MEKRMTLRRFKLAISILLLALVIISVGWVYQFKRAEDLSLAVENQYVHSFHELVDYVEDLEVLLKKTMLATDAGQMAAISSEIFMQSAAAKSNLAQLPVSGNSLASTSKFLSQVGDYSSYLSKKVIYDETISAEEYENLDALCAYAETVTKHLQLLQDKLYGQRLSFQKVMGITASAAAETTTIFDKNLEALEESFQDYPSLIYDGPFSEHLSTRNAAAIKNMVTIDDKEAMDCAKVFLGDMRSDNLTYTGEINDSLGKCYGFSSELDANRQISLAVTAQGGKVLYLLDNRPVSKEILSISQATEKALTFLQQRGFRDLKSSYFEKSNGVATINFAAMQDNVILYSDLIKVKVALDNGEILGFESKGYLMNHARRSLSPVAISVESARDSISSYLSVDSVNLALIPLESQREVLCYEFHGSYREQNFLIYINVTTGEEEKILLLQESENGILTV